MKLECPTLNEMNLEALTKVKDAANNLLGVSPTSFTFPVLLKELEQSMANYDHRYGTCPDCYEAFLRDSEGRLETCICRHCGKQICTGCEEDSERYRICEFCCKIILEEDDE